MKIIGIAAVCHEAAIKKAVECELDRIMDVFDDMRYELPDFITAAIRSRGEKESNK